MYLTHNSHGGECCGMSHLYEFNGWNSEQQTLQEYLDLNRKVRFSDKLKVIEEGLARCRSYDAECGCVEVVLAQEQFQFWERALQRSGFKRVFEFYNSNTGNRCRVYLCQTGATNEQSSQQDSEDKIPF